MRGSFRKFKIRKVEKYFFYGNPKIRCEWDAKLEIYFCTTETIEICEWQIKVLEFEPTIVEFRYLIALVMEQFCELYVLNGGVGRESVKIVTISQMVALPPYFLIVNPFFAFFASCIVVMWIGEYACVPGNYI